jgi:outer membrane lipoprotein-sorting protein
MGVTHQAGTVVIQLRSDNNRAKSNLTLVLAEPALELRQWTILDPQGLATTIALRDLQPGAAVSDSLFVLPQKIKRPSK